MAERYRGNKYKRWYNAFIARAWERDLQVPGEKHHIVPKCMGGTNASSNIVKLTYREHFLAHWLLTKFVTGSNRGKMFYALQRMVPGRPGRSGRTGWQVVLARRLFAKSRIGHEVTAETRAKIRIKHLGLVPSEETRLKISAAKRKRDIEMPMSLEQRKAIGLRSLGNQYGKGYKFSEEEREARRKRMLGHKWWKGRHLSPEHKVNCSKAKKAYWEAHPNTKLSDETRSKMRASRMAYLAKQRQSL